MCWKPTLPLEKVNIVQVHLHISSTLPGHPAPHVELPGYRAGPDSRNFLYTEIPPMNDSTNSPVPGRASQVFRTPPRPHLRCRGRGCRRRLVWLAHVSGQDFGRRSSTCIGTVDTRRHRGPGGLHRLAAAARLRGRGRAGLGPDREDLRGSRRCGEGRRPAGLDRRDHRRPRWMPTRPASGRPGPTSSTSENQLEKCPARLPSARSSLYEEGAATQEAMISAQTTLRRPAVAAGAVQVAAGTAGSQRAHRGQEPHVHQDHRADQRHRDEHRGRTRRWARPSTPRNSVPKILRIANLDLMTIKSEVSEADVSRLEPEGNPVYFTTLGGSTRRWTSTLKRIEPTPNVTNSVVTLQRAARYRERRTAS